MQDKEIKEFEKKIVEDILPHIVSLSKLEIKNIIDEVQIKNPTLPKGFGEMLYAKILEQKHLEEKKGIK